MNQNRSFIFIRNGVAAQTPVGRHLRKTEIKIINRFYGKRI